VSVIEICQSSLAVRAFNAIQRQNESWLKSHKEYFTHSERIFTHSFPGSYAHWSHYINTLHEFVSFLQSLFIYLLHLLEMFLASPNPTFGST